MKKKSASPRKSSKTTVKAVKKATKAPAKKTGQLKKGKLAQALKIGSSRRVLINLDPLLKLYKKKYGGFDDGDAGTKGGGGGTKGDGGGTKGDYWVDKRKWVSDGGSVDVVLVGKRGWLNVNTANNKVRSSKKSSSK